MKQITKEAYLMGRITEDKLTPEQDANMLTLLAKVNKLLLMYNKDITVNSGYRSPSDQQRINPSAPHSWHLECAAVDIGDRDHLFRYWVLMHLQDLESIGLWMEDPSHTPTWIHLQIYAPKSGHRIFMP